MSTLSELRGKFAERKQPARPDVWTMDQLTALRVNFEPLITEMSGMKDASGRQLYQLNDLRIKFGAAHPHNGKLVTQLANTERMALRIIWKKLGNKQVRAFIQSLLSEDEERIKEITASL
jgi:hypothetical protein